MDNENIILNYTNKHYQEECKLIENSLINYYYLRLKEGKTKKEIFHQKMLYELVIDLMKILSITIVDEIQLNLTSDDIFEHLKDIHIKT